jgi:hypothetical protein
MEQAGCGQWQLKEKSGVLSEIRPWKFAKTGKYLPWACFFSLL